MSENKDFDFGKLMDSVLDTAKSIGENIAEKGGKIIKDSGISEYKDYYPLYTWPPANLYTTEDNALIFEFGLPGFVKDDISISFEGDYMHFSAKLSNIFSAGIVTRSYKKKLKLKDISDQKYFLPEDKFDRENYSMDMENGLLRVVFNQL